MGYGIRVGGQNMRSAWQLDMFYAARTGAVEYIQREARELAHRQNNKLPASLSPTLGADILKEPVIAKWYDKLKHSECYSDLLHYGGLVIQAMHNYVYCNTNPSPDLEPYFASIMGALDDDH
jgi:hypothetical protein